ncbi:hypothetical protein [uncultured Hymenobacter sp.]|uniref:hypothetical protein n=1 Tax=uncultured Hymenobacter sp. TaxID=170016 RepID=UPI0035CB9FA8
MRHPLLLVVFLVLLAGAPQAARAQNGKSAPFSYLPEQGEDRYNQRVPRKSLPLPGGAGFVILAHQSAGGYAVERYDTDLKRLWSTAVPVAAGETVEAFSRGPAQVWVVIHHADDAGQNLSVQPVSLDGGQFGPRKVVVTALPRERRPGVAVSPDGARLLAFRYFTRNQQVKSMQGVLYDQNLSQTIARTYDFRDQGDFFSPTVHLANDGTQFVALIGSGMKQLSVRRYAAVAADNTVRALSLPAGGTFEGRPITIRDARFQVLADGRLYAAALCADYQTGAYYSLKAVRFDFGGAGDVKIAPEVRFTPAYLAKLTEATGAAPTPLQDLYLAELLLTEERRLVVIAEKHYEEGGPTLPVHARELHLVGYNEFMGQGWQTILAKDQVAPAVDAYTGIGFRAAAFGSNVQLLTLETLDKKSDLYLRTINGVTGAIGAPQRLRISVAADQELAYVKDFTTWLDAKNIVGVTRPSKKSAALRLNKISIK